MPTIITDAFSKQNKGLVKGIEASYLISLNIAKSKKPHTFGEELIEPSCIQITSLLCGEIAANKIKSIPLSAETVKRRIDDMAQNCQQQLLDKVRECKFAVQLDESRTISSEALLLIFVRYISNNNLQNEMLYLVDPTSRTTSADIFEAVDSFFKEHNLNYENLVGCCTDRAAAMMGKTIGFNTRLKVVAPHCRIYIASSIGKH